MRYLQRPECGSAACRSTRSCSLSRRDFLRRRCAARVIPDAVRRHPAAAVRQSLRRHQHACGLTNKAENFRVSAAHTGLQFDHGPLDVRRTHIIEEIEAQGRNHIARASCTVTMLLALHTPAMRPRSAWMASLSAGSARSPIRAPSIPREQSGDSRQNDCDDQRGHAIPAGYPRSAAPPPCPRRPRLSPKSPRNPRTRRCECRRVLRAPNASHQFKVRLRGAECAHADQHDALSNASDTASHDIDDDGLLEGHRVAASDPRPRRRKRRRPGLRKSAKATTKLQK